MTPQTTPYYSAEKTKKTIHQALSAFTTRHQYPEFELKAVLFDMDGVLFNSMPYHAKAWAKVMQAHGMDFSEYDAYMNEGRTGKSTVNEFFSKKYGHEASESEIQAIYKEKSTLFEKMGTIYPIPHVFELLQKIKASGKIIFIVTGSGQKCLLDTLNKNFPDIFDTERMVTAFDVKHGKPDPEPYLMALKKGQLQPWQSIVIENAPLGIRSAVNAGIFTIGVNTGILDDKELIKEKADIVFPDIKKILDVWDIFT